MNRTIEVSLTHAEGAIVRTLGLIERRGFVVQAVATRSEPHEAALVLLRRSGFARPADRRARAADTAPARRPPCFPGRAAGGRAAPRMLNEAPGAAARAAASPAAGAWVVHKFGGSSLADAACFRRVAGHRRRARGGARRARAVGMPRRHGCPDQPGGGRGTRRPRGLPHQPRAPAGAARGDRGGAARRRAGARLRRGASAPTSRTSSGCCRPSRCCAAAGRDIRDRVAGFGELWSSRLFSATCERAHPASACAGSTPATSSSWNGARWARACSGRSRASVPCAACRADDAGVLVIPGFVATDTRGLQTTLGRNGSDFSASIFGALLGAREIVIWTDVRRRAVGRSRARCRTRGSSLRCRTARRWSSPTSAPR